jgi:hypothetical protein
VLLLLLLLLERWSCIMHSQSWISSLVLVARSLLS